MKGKFIIREKPQTKYINLRRQWVHDGDIKGGDIKVDYVKEKLKK